MAIKVANNNSLASITALPSAVSGGAITLLETQTASSSSTLSFTSNIDSDYKEYVFKFINIHPASDGVHFQFQGNAAGGSGYDETITSASFSAAHKENDATTYLSYDTSYDLAQGTGFQTICSETANDNDSSISGTLNLAW